MVQGPPDGLKVKDVGSVMQALARTQGAGAVDLLARKLADPKLGDEAVAALRQLGPEAENAALNRAFDADPAVRRRAQRLLTDFGTPTGRIAAVALLRLKSAGGDGRTEAAAWLANNGPQDPAQQAEVARALAGLLDDLSPHVNALALHALKRWATADNLPALLAFARRGEKAEPCAAELIDLLSRFDDEKAAEALAAQLKLPASRALAAEALRKLGPTAAPAVLRRLDDPDPAVRRQARELSEVVGAPVKRQVGQLLADLADLHKPVALAALRSLTELRPDASSRPEVSRALNGPLLDADPVIRSAGLDATRVWGTDANTATLLKLLAKPGAGPARDPRVIALLGALQDPAAAPVLAEGLARPDDLDVTVKALVAMGPVAEDAVTPYLLTTDRGPRFAAAYVLGQIGTRKSLHALDTAGRRFNDDGDFNARTQAASDTIAARTAAD
jgi:hypothetical protein